MTTPTLGVAAGYEVFLTKYLPDRTHSRLQWNQLSWARRRGEASEASAECDFGDLFDHGERAECWSHGLRIHRTRAGAKGDDMVWWGPIRNISVDPNTGRTTIGAIDAMGLTARRRLRIPDEDSEDRSITLTDVDVATVFGRLVSEAMQPDLRGLVSPAFSTGVLTTRIYKLNDLELISSQIQEIAQFVRWSVVANELVVVGVDGISGSSMTSGGGPYPAFGTFGPKAFVEVPRLEERGDEMATEVVIPGADNGEEGFRLSWGAQADSSATGTLTRVVPSTFFRPTDSTEVNWDEFFENMAAQMLRAWMVAPIITSGGSLAPDAPVGVNAVIPGTAWQVDIDIKGRPALSGLYLLDNFDVDVSEDDNGALREQMRPTLVPLESVGLQI